MHFRTRYAQAVLFALLVIGVHTGFAKGDLKIDHTVSLSDPSTQQFHITTNISNIDQDRLDLSLPTWTPGWSTVENYGKNLLRFRITDASGKTLPLMMSRKQTWNVKTRGVRQIHIDYDYRATVLALNQAKINEDFAFFTGIELFLQPEGHRDAPSTVHFRIPPGWKIATALKDTSDPMTFTAVDYDTLVDAPVEMGKFDVTRFEVEGKPHYFIANPAGTFSKEKSDKFVGMLTKVAKAQSAIFGGLPYDKYVYFYFFAPPESNASGALEHMNSFVAFAPAGSVATPEMILGTASHEFFHVWNVKRIRPAEMWPYDYSRENETPLLWFSEGFTNYYGALAVYRAGLMTADDFLQRVADTASGIEGSEARSYISPANSSVSTWVGYDTPVAFGISYYSQGQNIAALLDLSIRHDTDGKAGLDDVMRALFNENYKRGRGFTTEDMIRVVNRLSGKDYHDFYQRFVFGTDVPDYDTIFGYAGYKVQKVVQKAPIFGFNGRFRSGGLAVNSVDPKSPASAAGLQVGDVIVRVDGTPAQQVSLFSLTGKTINLDIERGGTAVKLPMTVGSRDNTGYNLAAISAASPKQIKIREGWLKR
ncbi:MAG: PDZ domain-containing protein [Pyrinomonadaceae bacterium]